MKRVVIKFKDGTHINTEADFVAKDEEFLTAWNGDSITALARLELVQTAYLCEIGQEQP